VGLVLFCRYSISSFRAYAKLLEEESSRGEDFLQYLRRIEFEAAIIADNPNFDLGLETTQQFLEDKSTELMSAIINFFNAALNYFCHNFARTFYPLLSNIVVNLSKTLLNGPQAYQKSKDRLDVAIREYDQAVMHLTARLVAGTPIQTLAYERYEAWTRLKPKAKAG